MLFTALASICWLLMDLVILLIPTIPLFPEQMETNVINGINLLLDNGLNLVKLFCDYSVLQSCLTVVVTVYGLIFTYSIVQFILRKLPFINIS